MKPHEDKLLRENIKQLIKDHGPRRMLEGVNQAVLERMEGLLASCGISLNDAEMIDNLIFSCEQWAQEKNPHIHLREINPNETQSIMESLVQSVTPKEFARLLKAARAVYERKALEPALEAIFFQISDPEIKHVVSQTLIAVKRPNAKISFSQVKKAELRAQLVNLLETHGGEALAGTAQQISASIVQRKISAQLNTITARSPFHYAAAVGNVVNIMRYAAEHSRER